MNVSPQILNEAMCVYVQTYSMRDRLEEHITRHGLEEHRDEIVLELDAVLKTAVDHLYDYPVAFPGRMRLSVPTESCSLRGILGWTPTHWAECLDSRTGFVGTRD